MWRTYSKPSAPKEAPKLCDIDLAGFPVVLELLLDYGLDFAVIVIADKQSKKFLRFRKHLPDDDCQYIELALPITDWSAPFVDGIIAASRERGFEFLRQEAEYEGSRLEFLYVFFGQDVVGASGLSQEIMQKLYELLPAQKFEVSASGIARGLGKITMRSQLPDDTPDFPRY